MVRGVHAKSLAILRSFGRFLEIGKRDIYENRRLGLRPFRKNLSYSAIDINWWSPEQVELTGKLFQEVMSLCRAGYLPSTPA